MSSDVLCQRTSMRLRPTQEAQGDFLGVQDCPDAHQHADTYSDGQCVECDRGSPPISRSRHCDNNMSHYLTGLDTNGNDCEMTATMTGLAPQLRYRQRLPLCLPLQQAIHIPGHARRAFGLLVQQRHGRAASSEECLGCLEIGRRFLPFWHLCEMRSVER